MVGRSNIEIVGRSNIEMVGRSNRKCAGRSSIMDSRSKGMSVVDLMEKDSKQI